VSAIAGTASRAPRPLDVPVGRLRLLVAVALLPVGLLLSAPAAGAEPIRNSNYTLEYYQGPITSASRVVGLAGAFTALAEWCEGEYSNAASPAVRPAYSLDSFDYDVCLGFMLPGAFGNYDFENAGVDSGPSRFQQSASINLGLQLVYGRFGVTVDYDTYNLLVPGIQGVAGAVTGGGLLELLQNRLNINRFTSSVATSFVDGQLLVGVGARAAIFHDTTDTSQGTASTFRASGAGVQVGVIWRPRSLPLRLGGTVRSDISITDINSDAITTLPGGGRVSGGRILPSKVVLPSELELGAAFEFGARPFNPEWFDPAPQDDFVRARYQRLELERAEVHAKELEAARPGERARRRLEIERAEERASAEDDALMTKELRRLAEQRKARTDLWSRQTAVVMASVLVTGGVDGATSLTGFIDRQLVPYGSSTTVSPRVAFEGELVKHWVMLRTGSYLEPSLYDDVRARVHFTGGLDIKLVVFNPLGLFGPDPWRLRLAADGADRYFNTTWAIGKYH
jgi:hypothetical protein